MPAILNLSNFISLLLHAVVLLEFGRTLTLNANPADLEIEVVQSRHPVRPLNFSKKINETSFKTANPPEASAAILNAPPEYLKKPAPAYPVRARNLGQQGLVELEVEIGSDGRVLNLRLKRSSGYFMLDDAAVTAVKQWEFLPANRGGVLVDSKVEVPVRFRIANGNSEISLKN